MVKRLLLLLGGSGKAGLLVLVLVLLYGDAPGSAEPPAFAVWFVLPQKEELLQFVGVQVA